MNSSEIMKCETGFQNLLWCQFRQRWQNQEGYNFYHAITFPVNYYNCEGIRSNLGFIRLHVGLTLHTLFLSPTAKPFCARLR